LRKLVRSFPNLAFRAFVVAVSVSLSAGLCLAAPDAPKLSQAQPAKDDPYGVTVPATASDSSAPDTLKKDSVKAAARVQPSDSISRSPVATPDSLARKTDDSLPSVDSALAVDTAASVKPVAASPSVDSAASDSVSPPAKTTQVKRQKVVREVTVNTLDVLKGKYRSPKKALFMSLVVPGLGQAYVGQTAFNYARAASYFLIDVGLGVAWYQYVHVKHDRQVKKYRRYADENWRLSNYEDSLQQRFGTTQGEGTVEAFQEVNVFRDLYCQSIFGPSPTGSAAALFNGCNAYDIDSTDYFAQLGDFTRAYDDRNLTPQQIGEQRAGFFSPFDFYENIGKEQEFIVGWTDVDVTARPDTGWEATSDQRDNYVEMRRTAERYSKMQAYFIGGMVLNHIVSAIDAALAARAHNRYLYETETAWWDRVRLDSRIALQKTDLQSWVGAYLTF